MPSSWGSRRRAVTAWRRGCAAYFAASWIQYAAYAPAYPDGSPVSFATYFDVTTRAFAWQQKDGTAGESYGIWGYAYRALEVVGFCLGSLIAPFKLRGRAYCESCSLYMRNARFAALAASVPFVKAKKGDSPAAAAHDSEQRGAYESAISALDELHGFAEANDPSGFRDRLKVAEIAANAARKLPQRIAVNVHRCPRCESGEMRSTLWSGFGQREKSLELARTPLAQFFARDLAP